MSGFVHTNTFVTSLAGNVKPLGLIASFISPFPAPITFDEQKS